MNIPPQCPPVQRDVVMGQARLNDTGVEAAQDPCASLPGMAQQMCYEMQYGIST